MLYVHMEFHVHNFAPIASSSVLCENNCPETAVTPFLSPLISAKTSLQAEESQLSQPLLK